jgi:glycosyltransferase involved in cell wall biosynthesis
VTVVVPAYNHGAYIETCLDSIADSDYAPLEIVVLDDGSIDDTYMRACDWMKSNEHRVSRVDVRKQTNQGIARTLNRLVSQAQGDYVAILASDDTLEPDGIALRVSALERHPEWLAVFGDCSIIDANGLEVSSGSLGSVHHDMRALLNPRRIARELILRWYVPGPATLARRTAYDTAIGAGQYDEGLDVEDRDFYLRLLAINAVGCIPERVARYRIHGERSTSRQFIVERDGVLSEWRNITSFHGLNRGLLFLVAIRGFVRVRYSQKNGQGNCAHSLALQVVSIFLGMIKRGAYVLHRFFGTYAREN